MKTDSIEIRKISLNSDIWVAFARDKMLLGGSFLPPDTHLTISFGLRSRVVDLHVTKNLEQGAKVHLPLLVLIHDDTEELVRSISLSLLQFVLGMSEKTNLLELSKKGCMLVPIPEDTSSHEDYFLNSMKPYLSSFVVKKGRGKYRIHLDDEQMNNLLRPLVGDDTEGSLMRFLKEQVYSPLAMQEAQSGSAMVIGLQEFAILLRLPFKLDGSRDYLFSASGFKREAQEFISLLKRDPSGAAILKQWQEGLTRIRDADSQESVDDFIPLRISPIEYGLSAKSPPMSYP